MFSLGIACIQSFLTRKTCHLTRFVIQVINFGIAFSYRKMGPKVWRKLRRFILIYLFFSDSNHPNKKYHHLYFFLWAKWYFNYRKWDFLILIFLPRNSENNWTKKWKKLDKKRKSRTPSIPRRSPIQVLTGLDVA